MELPGLEEKREVLEKHLGISLSPKIHTTEKTRSSVRAGTGGDEASRCLRTICYACYLKYCENGWRTAILSESKKLLADTKRVQVEVVGDDVYGIMKFKAVFTRCSRFPIPEASGGCQPVPTVAVMPNRRKSFELKE